MAEASYSSKVYRLRASSPMPITGSTLILHSFGAEVSDVDIFECTQSLPASTEFRGQGGNLMSASFSRLGDSQGHFQGQQVHAPEYIEEDSLGFNF